MTDPQPQPSRRRRFRAVAVTAVACLVAGAAGFAIAAYLSRATIEGGVRSAGFAPVWTSASKQVGSAACGDVGLQGGTLIVNPAAQGAWPGDTCTVSGTVRVDGTAEGRVVGMDLEVPVGWTARLTGGCGAVVPTSGGVPVEFRVAMTGDAALTGASAPFPAGSGVRVQPASEPFVGAC